MIRGYKEFSQQLSFIGVNLPVGDNAHKIVDVSVAFQGDRDIIISINRLECDFLIFPISLKAGSDIDIIDSSKVDSITVVIDDCLEYKFIDNTCVLYKWYGDGVCRELSMLLGDVCIDIYEQDCNFTIYTADDEIREALYDADDDAATIDELLQNFANNLLDIVEE